MYMYNWEIHTRSIAEILSGHERGTLECEVDCMYVKLICSLDADYAYVSPGFHNEEDMPSF